MLVSDLQDLVLQVGNPLAITRHPQHNRIGSDPPTGAIRIDQYRVSTPALGLLKANHNRVGLKLEPTLIAVEVARLILEPKLNGAHVALH